MEPLQTKPQKWRRAGHIIGVYLSLLYDEAKLSENTIFSRDSFLKTFAHYCAEKSDPYCEKTIDEVLLSVDKTFIESYRDYLLYERRANKRSVSTIISAIRHFYGWLIETNLINCNPFWVVPKPTYKAVIKPKPPKKVYQSKPRPLRAKRLIAITLEQVKLKRKEPETGISIMAAVEKWIAYNKRYAEDTQRQYHDTVLRFIDELPDDILTITQLTSVHLRDFITNELGKGRKHSTVNTHLTALQSFCRWLSEQYDIDNAATKVRNLKAEPSQSRFLSHEEYQKVLVACNSDGCDKEIIELLGNTGLRASELANLKWGNVASNYSMLNLTGKGRKFRHIPCNDVVKSILKKYLRQADTKKLQLLELRPYPTSRDSLYRLCYKLSKRAGIEKFGPHAIRHYFATELLKRKVPIYYVSKVLGHSSVVITERLYVHFQPEFLNGITDCLLTGGAICSQ